MRNFPKSQNVSLHDVFCPGISQGGVKKSTMEGIQLRGDINVCLWLGWKKNRWHVVWPNCLKALSQTEWNDCQRWIKHLEISLHHYCNLSYFCSDPTDLRGILQAYHFGWPGWVIPPLARASSCDGCPNSFRDLVCCDVWRGHANHPKNICKHLLFKKRSNLWLYDLFLRRAVFTSGKSSTAAGLTASVVQDRDLDQERLIEPGALMLAVTASGGDRQWHMGNQGNQEVFFFWWGGDGYRLVCYGWYVDFWFVMILIFTQMWK